MDFSNDTVLSRHLSGVEALLFGEGISHLQQVDFPSKAVLWRPSPEPGDL